METIVLNKPKTRIVDWINPRSEEIVTLEEYRNEMQVAENSGFVSFEDHKKTMNKWLTSKLQ